MEIHRRRSEEARIGRPGARVLGRVPLFSCLLPAAAPVCRGGDIVLAADGRLPEEGR